MRRTILAIQIGEPKDANSTALGIEVQSAGASWVIRLMVACTVSSASVSALAIAISAITIIASVMFVVPTAMTSATVTMATSSTVFTCVVLMKSLKRLVC